MPADPTLSEVIRDAIEARLADLYTCTVGRIVTYNPALQVADIQLVVQRAFNIGNDDVDTEDIAVLPNVPVKWPRAGGYYIHLPIQAGDHCTVIFTHDSIAMWRETGSVSIPGDLRRHSLGSAIAIPGIYPFEEPLDPDPLAALARLSKIVIGKDGSPNYIAIGDDGIMLGQLAISPVALAVPLLAYIGAAAAAATAGGASDSLVATALTAMQAAIVAIAATPPISANPAVAPLVTAAGTAVTAAATATAASAAAATAGATAATTAAGAVPAVLTKAQ